MFTRIRNHITIKWLTGIMLIGVTLSFPVSFLKMKEANQSRPLPAARGAVRKPPASESTPVNPPVIARPDSQNAPQPERSIPISAASGESSNKNQAPWTPNQQPAQAQSQNNRNEADIYLLARVINAEARGEPFTGQVAVGAVLLNRLQDKRFPKTLSQIIFKRGEFCTVRDGQIWMAPSSQAIRAARLAASGWDPTGGAVYFYNPAKTTSHWIWSRPVVNKIGHHIFAV